MPIDVGGNSVRFSGITEYGNYTHRVVRSGLLGEWDAGHPDSYPGSGTSWFDLTGNGNTLTLNGSPSHGSVSGVTCFTIDTDSQYATGSFLSPTINCTIESWISLTGTELGGSTGTDRGAIVYMGGGNAIYHSYNKTSYKLSSYWTGKNLPGYHESGAAISHQKWHHVVSVWNGIKIYQWLDGVLTSVDNVFNTSTQNSSIYIGRQQVSGTNERQMAGLVSLVRVYDRGLNSYEIAENYQAHRIKFGL
jgi:hypothetical protein